ncbi:MAG: diguanylate cyclase, partial [Clostridiales bacterium]|nr:diguanylate cyclase [Clostridiales bacterium]
PMSDRNAPRQVESIIIEVINTFRQTGKVNYLNEEEVSESDLPLVRLFNELLKDIADMNSFTLDLSKGRLHREPPPGKNLITGALKNLHAQLRHLTWQAKQVALGDYSQNVDYLGEFSDAFNVMTSQLAEREKRLQNSHTIMLRVLENTPDPVIVMTDAMEILFSNRAAKFLLKNHRSEDPDCFEHNALIKSLFAQRIPPEKESTSFEVYDSHNNSYYSVRTSNMAWIDGATAILFMLHDITKAKEQEIALRSVAFWDAVTGIGNRNGALNYLQDLLDTQTAFTIIFADMDGLKNINDLYGHNEGDFALRTLAQGLKSAVRQSEHVFRLGGDEFLVVLLNSSEEEAKRIISDARSTISIHDKPYEITFSFGVIHVEGNMSMAVEQIIQSADKKMYAEKNIRKRNNYGKR